VPRPDSERSGALFYLGASLIALCFLPFAAFGIPLPAATLPWQRQIIGAAFSAICLLGALAGISPSTCSRLSPSKPKLGEPSRTANTNSGGPIGRRVQKQGHHATCSNYGSHVVHIAGAVHCAGCTGLVLGAATALAGSTLYFFVGIPLPCPLFAFWLGFAGVALGLLQHPLYALFRTRRGGVRVVVNITFVVGAFLLLSSVADLTGNLMLEAFLLLAILYWIFTRIAMSRRSHREICTRCGDKGCPLSEAPD